MVADAAPFVRLAVRDALVEGGVDVVAEAGDGAGVLGAAGSLRPDVLLLDADLDPELATTRAVAEAVPEISIVLLSADVSDRLALAVVRAGGCGLVSKAIAPDRLPAIVRGVVDGEAAIPRRVMRTLLGEIRRDAAGRAGVGPAGLSQRECEVLELLDAGLSDRDIGERLVISEITVRRHAASATRKLGARHRLEAVAAYRAA